MRKRQITESQDTYNLERVQAQSSQEKSHRTASALNEQRENAGLPPIATNNGRNYEQGSGNRTNKPLFKVNVNEEKR